MTLHDNHAKKLYRRVNTTTRHHSNNPGAEYRHGRHRKKLADDLLPQRESMRGKQQRGLDYTPLFNFLMSKVGQQWDDVFSEANSRLDRPDPIFWMVALHEHQQRDYVRCGDFAFFPGLYVDENRILQQVNPHITAEDIPVTCRCCTHTFVGVPLVWRDEPTSD
ncbi:hypothetical protein CTZ24_25465 (plasmid) [Pantoea phytobeneficialis]|uniref:Uncharacterized protein n=1 Tax=Pantoea phytobeneficialis TaxID=2052056 RepID=A0AAP9HBJ7_9GAMM|nr:hypothetical protein [Pantoea phytobeneficialis]MDO6409921.1 hypothetical protein [Pantoea phytobeneficialis]QGR09826.1 hypothetical protein CTZ24_25465 [Pantoea phytobeneficialis]